MADTELGEDILEVFETDDGMALIAVHADGSIFVGVDDDNYDFGLDGEKSLALARAIIAAHEAKVK